MTREEINAWFSRVCQECLDECNELESPGASFGAGMAMGVIVKNLYLLEEPESEESDVVHFYNGDQVVETYRKEEGV